MNDLTAGFVGMEIQKQDRRSDNGISFQDGSLFFTLPTELRLQIYNEVFDTSVLTFGKTVDVYGVSTQFPNSLALLKTCRRIRDEIDDSWVSKVVFSFETPIQMVDKLLTLPQGAVSDVRRVQVQSRSTLLNVPDAPLTAFGLPFMIRFLPGLSLNELTVLGQAREEGQPSDQWTDIQLTDHLITWTSCWKTLYYVAYDSEVFWETYYYPDPNPLADIMRWQQQLELRDGAASMPTITVYPAGDDKSSPAPGHWHMYKQAGMPPLVPGNYKDLKPAWPTFDLAEDEFEVPFFEGPVRENVNPGFGQMMAVFERGAGASLVQRPGQPHPFEHEALPEWVRQASWQQVRHLCTSSNAQYRMVPPFAYALSVIDDYDNIEPEVDSGVEVHFESRRDADTARYMAWLTFGDFLETP